MRLYVIVILCLISPLMSFSQEKDMAMPKIIYVYDALCGWCYGFSPVIQKLQKEHGGQWDFKVISGGMVTGTRVEPIVTIAPYIQKAYKEVEKASGVKFGAEFLNKTLKEGKIIMDSEPPAIAMAVFKSFSPEKAVEYAAAIQKAIYYDGFGPADLSIYPRLADTFGIDETEFTKRLNENKYKSLAEEEFIQSSELGVNGFPTVFVEFEGKTTPVAVGFCSYNTLLQRINNIVRK
jgi:putative protein-disulfide isomerase